jgi:hypothetical protein
MTNSNKRIASSRSQDDSAAKVVNLYQVRPEMALAHLKRTTGLEFDTMPQSLVNFHGQPGNESSRGEPPMLTDVVDGHG